VQPDDINCGAGVVPCGDKAEAHKMKIITYDVRIEVSKIDLSRYIFTLRYTSSD
jgi:hypothetical protein